MLSQLKFTVLEERVVFDAALAAIIADITSNPSLSDVHLINEVSNVSGLHQIYVDASATGSNDGSSWGNAFTTIQSALTAAGNLGGNNEILVAEATYNVTWMNVPDGTVIFGGFATGGTAPVGSTVDALGRPVDVNGNLTEVTSLSGGDVGRIANVDNASVIIDGVTFTDGYAGNGGAISSYNSDLLLFNTHFNDNNAIPGWYSGALNAFAVRQLTVINSTFDNNIAANGGAITVWSTSSITLFGDTFTSNRATDFAGAALLATNFSTLNIMQSTFDNNNSQNYGGAIAVVGWAGGNGTLLIDDTSFTNNHAGADGGALYAESTNMTTIKNSTFNDNTSNTYSTVRLAFSNIVNVNDNDFVNNTSNLDGTLSLVNNTTANVTGNRFIDNESINSTGGIGGAIRSWYNGNVLIDNNEFSGNSAAYAGGAIADQGSYMVISNNLFDSNKADQGGGAVRLILTRATLNNNTFENNTASYGGAIRAEDSSSVIIDNNTFTENKVTWGGGGAISTYNSNLTVKNSDFNSNEAMQSSGGAINSFNDINILMDNNTFTGNYAAGNSGGVEIQRGIYTIISNNLFDTNNAAQGGGAVRLAYTQGTLNNNTFENNTASYGGALLVENNNSPIGVTVDNSTFTENKATLGGGAISANASNLTVKNSDFNSNEAMQSDGGAINLVNGYYSIDTSTFTGNKAEGSGGAIRGDVSLNLTNSNFYDNEAMGYGGAVALYLTSSYNLWIAFSTFTGNTAGQSGGAIYINESITMESSTAVSLYITDSLFNDNTALGGSGGAIEWGSIAAFHPTNADNYISLYESFSIYYSTFTGNTALLNGGAIHLNTNIDFSELELPIPEGEDEPEIVPGGGATHIVGNRKCFHG